ADYGAASGSYLKRRAPNSYLRPGHDAWHAKNVADRQAQMGDGNSHDNPGHPTDAEGNRLEWGIAMRGNAVQKQADDFRKDYQQPKTLIHPDSDLSPEDLKAIRDRVTTKDSADRRTPWTGGATPPPPIITGDASDKHSQETVEDRRKRLNDSSPG